MIHCKILTLVQLVYVFKTLKIHANLLLFFRLIYSYLKCFHVIEVKIHQNFKVSINMFVFFFGHSHEGFLDMCTRKDIIFWSFIIKQSKILNTKTQTFLVSGKYLDTKNADQSQPCHDLTSHSFLKCFFVLHVNDILSKQNNIILAF